MPNTRKMLKALVSAFNVNNYFSNTLETNFTLQIRCGKDCIVVSFDKSMNDDQCSEYLYGIKRKIVGEFYNIEEDTDERMLKAAKLIFDVNSLPFDISKGKLLKEQGRAEFVTPVDKGVILNLKSHLAASLAKDVLEDMPTCNLFIKALNKKGCLWHSEFPDKESLQQFEREFLSKMKERYENVPKNPLKVKDNSLYIKDVFDDAHFVDSITRYFTWLEGIQLEVNSSSNYRVKMFKNMIIRSLYQSTGVEIDGFVCTSPLGKEVASILIPLVLDSGRKRILTNEEALKLNCAFNYAIFNDLYGRTQGELSMNGGNVVYGIDFSNPYISHCVVTKIIESSVINKDHELAIDPELVRALSPVQSPVRVPNGPSSYFTESLSPTQEFPTRDQNVVLKYSPRQGSEKEALYNHINPDGPSKGFSPSPQLNSIAVSYGVSGPSSSLQSVGAAQNVRAGTSAWTQPIGFWSSLAPSAGPSLWLQSGPSSSKGANPVGTNPWAQQTNHWSSSKDADKDAKTTWYVPLPLTTGNDPLQVTDKSVQGARGEPLAPLASDENDRESSDECSEAKSQESESPKKRRGGFSSKISAIFSPSKSKHDASLNRCDVGRDTTRSVPAISVTEKPPVSKSFLSFPTRKKAKSNPPSKVTSPVHSTINGSIPVLPSQGTTVVESSSGPKRQTSLTPSKRKELYKVLSDEMKGKLNSSSFPPEYEELLYLLYVDKRELRLLLSDPKAKQVCSVLPPEKIEQVQSSSPEEVLRLLLSSKVDSPKTEKHLQKEREVFV